MKILGDTRLYPPRTYAGAELAMHGILRHLVEQGHEASVLVREGDSGEVDGVSVYAVPANEQGQQEALYGWADVALSHMEAGLHAQNLSALTGCPLVLLVHNDTQLTWTPHVYARLIVPNSRQLAAKIAHQHTGIEAVVVNPPVFEGDVVAPPGVSLTPGRSFDALQVGLSELKGGHLFWRLSQREVTRRFLGVLGGYGAQIDRGGENVLVEQHMPPRDLALRYGESQILLVPSVETWGRVAVEALANGMPVIAHPSDGLFEVMGRGLAASDGPVQWAYAGDPQAWSDALAVLDDPDAYDAASNAARARWDVLSSDQDEQLAALTRKLEEIAS